MPDTSQYFQISGFHYDPASRTVTRQSPGPKSAMRLSPKAASVLDALLKQAPSVVTHRDLVDEVWGENYPHEDVLPGVIREIRKAFGDTPRNSKIVATIPKTGYRLTGEARPVSRPAIASEDSRRTAKWVILSLALLTVALALIWRADLRKTASQWTFSGEVRLLTQYNGQERHPAWSADNRTIAFSWNRAGNFDLYLLDTGIENAQPLQLTSTEAEEGASVFSSDGTQLAFLRHTQGLNPCQVIVMDLTTRKEREIDNCHALLRSPYEFDGIAWSPDGQWLAYMGAPGADGVPAPGSMKLKNPETGEVRWPDPSGVTAGLMYPHWNEDSRRLLGTLYEEPAGGRVVMLDIDSGQSTLVAERESVLRYPHFLLDDSIVWLSQVPFAQVIEVLSSDGELSQLPALPGLAIQRTRGFVIAPDKHQFLFTDHQRRGTLFRLNLNLPGATLEPVLEPSQYIDRLPAVNPIDGSLAFVSSRGGSYRVWLKDRGEQPRPLSEDRALAAYPVWHPDGSKLAYRFKDAENQTFQLAIYNREERTTRVLPLPQYSDASLAFSPDGERLIYPCKLHNIALCSATPGSEPEILLELGRTILRAEQLRATGAIIFSLANGTILKLTKAGIEPLITRQQISFFPHWDLTGDTLIYATTVPGGLLEFTALDLLTGDSTTILRVAEETIDGYGFMAHAGWLYLSHYDQVSQDLMIATLSASKPARRQ